MTNRLPLAIAVAYTAFARADAAPIDEAPIVRAMKDEIAWAMSHLDRAGTGKPYFVSYSVWDLEEVRVRAELGALVASNTGRRRDVELDVRVGDYTLDNSNTVDPRRQDRDFRFRLPWPLPVSPDDAADRHELRTATERTYDRAAAMLEHKKSLATGIGNVPSFSHEPPARIVDVTVAQAPDLGRVESLARKLSAVFRKNRDVYESSVAITSLTGQQYFVSSEGAASVRPVARLRIEVECASRADDGMKVTDSAAWFVHAIDELPAESELVRQIEEVSRRLSAIRAAPVVSSYVGPVIFEGASAGEVIRALFGESLVGTPPRVGETGGRARPVRAVADTELADLVGRAILPAGTSIVDDPTLARAGKTILAGGYRFDAEGVAAQRTVLVENGMLKQFLMSRAPRKGFDHSNGHATARQDRAGPANLVVTSTKSVSNAQLRKQALAIAKPMRQDSVLVVERLAGADLDSLDLDSVPMWRGTFPRAAVAKRVYADGREEWVRGVKLPAPTRDDLVAFGAQPTVYSYGRDWSRYVTSVLAPPLLFRGIYVSREYDERDELPAVPRPPAP